MVKRLNTTGQFVDIEEDGSVSSRKIVKVKSSKSTLLVGKKLVVSKDNRQSMFINQIKRHPESMSKMINKAKLIKNLKAEDVRIIEICG
jgi:uncharacterized protein YlzI (FlbEa/FlbD family)